MPTLRSTQIVNEVQLVVDQLLDHIIELEDLTNEYKQSVASDEEGYEDSEGSQSYEED